jgi:hypothetical protein
METPHEATRDYLNYTIGEYQQLVGNDETLRAFFQTQANDPVNDP